MAGYAGHNLKGKSYKIKPKKRIKAIFDKYLEYAGTKGVSTIMRESGLYKEGTSKNPQSITNSKSWKQLLNEYLPDDLLAKKHLEGLEAYKLEDGLAITSDGDIGNANIKTPDFATRHKYLDSAYKLKGFYAEEKGANLNVVVVMPSEVMNRIAPKVVEPEVKALQ